MANQQPNPAQNPGQNPQQNPPAPPPKPKRRWPWIASTIIASVLVVGEFIAFTTGYINGRKNNQKATNASAQSQQAQTQSPSGDGLGQRVARIQRKPSAGKKTAPGSFIPANPEDRAALEGGTSSGNSSGNANNAGPGGANSGGGSYGNENYGGNVNGAAGNNMPETFYVNAGYLPPGYVWGVPYYYSFYDFPGVFWWFDRDHHCYHRHHDRPGNSAQVKTIKAPPGLRPISSPSRPLPVVSRPAPIAQRWAQAYSHLAVRRGNVSVPGYRGPLGAPVGLPGVGLRGFNGPRPVAPVRRAGGFRGGSFRAGGGFHPAPGGSHGGRH